LLRLTEAQSGQAGSAFALAPVALDNVRSFTSEFTFQLSGSAGGADGITGSPDALALADVLGVRQNVGFELNNGDECFVRIVYDDLTDLLQVFLTDDLGVGFGSALLERTIDLEALLGPSVFMGFTGGPAASATCRTFWPGI